MTFRALVIAISLGGLAMAQIPQPGHPGPDSAAAAWRAMSVREKICFDARHLLNIQNLSFAGVGAAVDEGRGRPGKWGYGWQAYSERYASHVGQYFVQQTITSPIRALDGEERAYSRSKHSGYPERLGAAFLHTFWRQSTEGEMMPAYSELAGDYGAAAVSRMWWPERYHRGRAIVMAGSNTVVIDSAINVFHEFTPDLERFLHLRR